MVGRGGVLKASLLSSKCEHKSSGNNNKTILGLRFVQDDVMYW
jgi:hypothetical protein